MMQYQIRMRQCQFVVNLVSYVLPKPFEFTVVPFNQMLIRMRCNFSIYVISIVHLQF
jgi:hypothetical protein